MNTKIILPIFYSCKILFGIFLLQGVPFTSVAIAQNSSPSALAIIQRMGDAYNKLDSYQDNGTIEKKIYVNSKLDEEFSVKFSTVLKRPNFQKVEWDGGGTGGISGQPGKWLLLNAGKESYLYSSKSNEYVQSGDSKLVTNYAESAAEWPVFNISWMFFYNIKLTPSGMLSSLRELPDENFEGFTCHVVTGVDPPDYGEYKLWIDATSYLLRRSEYYVKSAGKVGKSIIEKYGNVRSLPEIKEGRSLFASESHRNIKVNPSFSDDLFSFIPPANSIRREKPSYLEQQPISSSPILHLMANKTLYLFVIGFITLALLLLLFITYRMHQRRGSNNPPV